MIVRKRCERLSTFEDAACSVLQPQLSLVLRKGHTHVPLEHARYVYGVQVEVGRNRAQRLVCWIGVKAFKSAS